MPKMTGLEMVKKLKDDLRDSLPMVIFMSADVTDDNKVDALKLGAVDFVYKPFNDVEITTKLTNHLKSVSKKKNLSKQLQLAQVLLVNSLMSPHFLCNQLNDISFLVTEFPDKSVKHLNKLAGFYRNIMEYIKLATIKIEKEKVFIKDYIELNYLKDKDRYEIEISFLDVDLIKIPTMVIQPLLENAVKHGMSNCFENGRITVLVKVEDSHLIISVEDNGTGISKKQIKQLFKSNHALDNIKQRLNLIYGNNAELKIDSVLNEGTKITAKILV